ncbi:MAG: hypothetical protein RLZZ84_782 [Pseudomonadota bacterium]
MNEIKSKTPSSDKAWFAPKAFGYGAGMPIAWQGWAMLGLHAVLIGLAAAAQHYTHTARLPWIIGAALLPMPIYAAKTRGGWKWRWGKE